MKLAAWFLAVLSAVGLAEDLATVPPVLLTKSQPLYSEEARIARLQGVVRVALTVAADGTPRNIRVASPLGLGLDEKALDAVAGWRFRPGTQGGLPVAMRTEVECVFALPQDAHQWSLSFAVFRGIESVSRPVILSAPFRPRLFSVQHVTARVGFDITTQGMPVNIQVEQSSDPAVDDEVIALIREWRFQAALGNGTAYESHATFDLTAGLAPAEPAVRFPGPPQKKREI